MLQDALLRVSQRDNDGARTIINELLKLEPTSFRSTYLLVQTYFEQRQLPEGLKRPQEVADANPKAVGIQDVLVQWYMRAGDSRNARKAFEAAQARNAKYLSPELALAELDAADNHLDSAHQRPADVLRLEPENVGARCAWLASRNGLITGTRPFKDIKPC